MTIASENDELFDGEATIQGHDRLTATAAVDRVWLVNWLIDKLGGTVEAHTGIERGTTVTVRVPAAVGVDG